jgi:hypothetical protein
MSAPSRCSAFDRFISPPVLFLGMALGFAVCALGGYLGSRHNLIKHFQRFHNYINPGTQFYPTASQVRELVRSRVSPEKIAVLIGGNSILHGSLQAPPDLWSDRLQTLLGDRYQVINLGLCGTRPGEFGAIAAEMLCREYKKLILITNLSPGNFDTDPDGINFKYFFWDAYSKGFLQPNPARLERLRELALGDSEQADRRRELRTEMQLDSVLHFNDLWTTVAYKYFFTVWTPLTRESFMKARKGYQDSDWGPRPGHVRDMHDRGAHVRSEVEAYGKRPKEMWARFERAAVTCFAEPVRRRALLLVLWQSPDYLGYLTAGDRTGYARLSRQTVRRLEKYGFRAMEVGKDFLPADFGDSCHLVASGGAKLAEAVAPQVRKLARQLGYLREAP